MKLALVATLAATASAFAPQGNNARPTVSMQAENSRREAMASIAGAAAALVPIAANAAAGESPRFSVFGVIGDGSSYSEGAAYGSDQSAKLYSPYSVYGEPGTDDALYKPGSDTEGVNRKKAPAQRWDVSSVATPPPPPYLTMNPARIFLWHRRKTLSYASLTVSRVELQPTDRPCSSYSGREFVLFSPPIMGIVFYFHRV